jgi:hypothetical protein
MADFVNNETRVRMMLTSHLEAVATKDSYPLLKLFDSGAVIYGSDDSEIWTRNQLIRKLKRSEAGWDMRKCIKRDIQLVRPNIMTFFEVIQHIKYGLFRGSGVVVRNDDESWVISQYVLSFSVPNIVVDKTNILKLLAEGI